MNEQPKINPAMALTDEVTLTSRSAPSRSMSAGDRANCGQRNLGERLVGLVTGRCSETGKRLSDAGL